MSFIRNLSLFSNSEKSLSEIIFDIFCWLYERMPVNGATLTGMQHPGVSRLWGNNPFLGLASQLTAKDGLGLTRTLFQLADVAESDKRGIAYCNIVATPTMLVTRPSEIAQILIHNSKKVSRGSMIRVFGHIFGFETILIINTNPEWRKKRTHLVEWVFKTDALKNATLPIQKIIDEYIELLKTNNIVPSVQEFMVSLTMDIIARITLASKPLAENSQPLSKEFDKAMDMVNDPLNEIRENIAVSKLGACLEYFHLKTNANIDKQKSDLQTILTKHFLEPNIDEHGKCSFRENKNVFQEIFKKNPDNTTAFKQIIEDLGLFLLAAHETTANLLSFCFSVFVLHPEFIIKIREEIENHRPENNEWTKDNLKEMIFLGKFIKEVLRLYPPFPIFPREVTEEMILADIPFCRSEQEYKDAMAKRDVTKDLICPSGTRFIISPLITQRLASVFTDPLEFNPERHKSGVSSFISKSGVSANIDEFLIPFGMGDRECIGKLFSLQEAMLIIIKILDKFDLQGTLVNKDGSESKLLNCYIHNTLKPYGELNLTFTKRDKKDVGNSLSM